MTTLDTTVVGRWSAERIVEVTPDSVRGYAAAIGDASGSLSPVYAVVPGMDLVFEVAETACEPALRARVVHGQQDLVFHQPVPVGGLVTVRAAVVGLHGKASGTTATIKLEQRDPQGSLLNEQYVTEFYRGVGSDLEVGETAPPTGLPRESPAGEPVLTATVGLDEDLPRRYADASGDHNPIHLDEAFARAAGLPGVIVHGLASLAIATRTVLAAAGSSEIARLSCRFTRPVAPGDALTTRVWATDGSYRFEASDSKGNLVLGAGLLVPRLT